MNADEAGGRGVLAPVAGLVVFFLRYSQFNSARTCVLQLTIRPGLSAKRLNRRPFPEQHMQWHMRARFLLCDCARLCWY